MDWSNKVLIISLIAFFIDDQTYEDEICDAFSNIEETENGFRLRMPVPSGFFKYIIGKKGETKKRIENETKTQISIPRQGQKGDIGKRSWLRYIYKSNREFAVRINHFDN